MHYSPDEEKYTVKAKKLVNQLLIIKLQARLLEKPLLI
jgi:hypothetical protein